MITDLFLSVLEISLSTSLIALALILLAPFLNRRYAAKWNYLIWIFLGLRLLIPFQGPSLADILNQFTAPAAAQSENIPTATYPNETASEQRIIIEIPPQLMEPIVVPSEKSNTGITLLNAIAAVWFAGVFAFISLHFFSYLHYKRQVLKKGTALRDNPASQLLLRLSEELNIKQTVILIEYPEADSPMMMGFLKPVLVLPKECYNAEELYFILKHELVHLKRRDIYAKLLFMLANAVHWFNPLIWLMQKEAVIDMELSCDERVVQGAEYTVRRAYTETLFSTLRRKRAKKAMLSTQFYGGKQVMKKRFMNILEKAKKKNGAVLLMGAVALTIICGVLIGCSIDGSVTFGQENSQEEIQEIYSNVFKNYQKAKPLIYGALVKTGEEVSDENGQPYLLVTDSAYQSTASIQKALDSAFSTSYIETYLSWVLKGNYPLYKEIDGRLCVALADAVGEGLTENIIAVLEQNGNAIRIKIAGDPDDAEPHDYEVALVKENGRWAIDRILDLPAENSGQNGILMDGIDVPELVLNKARELVSGLYLLQQESSPECDYSNWRISSLSHCYTYENLYGMKLHLYQLNYELLSNAPEHIVLAGATSVTEDGWVTTDYPNSNYLVFQQSGEEFSFLTHLFENDCEPGDDIFTEDLKKRIPTTMLAYITAFDAHGLSFDTVEWVLIPSERATELGYDDNDGPSGFVIHNEEEKMVTLPFAENCDCTILDWRDSFVPAEITLKQFLSVLEERSNSTVPYWLTIENNEIVKIHEQYVP